MENSALSSLSPRDYVRILFKRKNTILTIVFFAVLMATAYTYLVLPTYEAVAQVLLIAEKKLPSPMADKLTPLTPYRQGIEVAAVNSEIMRGTVVVADVVKALDLSHRPNPKGIKGFIKVILDELWEWFSDFRTNVKNTIIAAFTGRWPEEKSKPSKFEKEIKRLSSKKVVKIEPLERTDIIAVKVRDYDPVVAAKIANAFARAFIVYNMEMQFEDLSRLYRPEHPRIVVLKNEIEQIRKEMKNSSPESLEHLAGKSSSGEIEILQSAVPPLGTIAPKKMLNILMAIVLSIISGIGVAFLLEIIDQTMKSPSDISEILGVRTLGSISVLDGEPGLKQSSGNQLRDISFSMDTISSELFLMKKEKNIKCILVVSANPGDGKTTLVVNLAEALARMTHGKILVIDGNLRNPSLARELQLNGNAGISSLSEGDISFKGLIQTPPSKAFSVITAGEKTSRPEVLLASKAMEDCLRAAKTNFDFILIDTPNLGNYKEVLGLSSLVDGAVFVVKTCHTRKYSAQAFKQMLAEKNIPLLGAVLNFREFVIPDAIYQKI